jgi:hypothetical protein
MTFGGIFLSSAPYSGLTVRVLIFSNLPCCTQHESAHGVGRFFLFDS